MSCDYCWPGNCCGGPNCRDAEEPKAPPEPKEHKMKKSSPMIPKRKPS